MKDFIECTICSQKPGSPILCDPYLKNRENEFAKIGYMEIPAERIWNEARK